MDLNQIKDKPRKSTNKQNNLLHFVKRCPQLTTRLRHEMVEALEDAC